MRTRAVSRFLLVAAPALAIWASSHAAAEVEMPRRSPRARVSQQVGLTEVAVEYDSPAVHGRVIWGAMVPYDQLWRRGEIPAPKVTFSRSVGFGDSVVPAGTYALLLVPASGDWTVMLNKRANLMDAERDYKPQLDVARIKARRSTVDYRERLTFVFSNFTNDEVSLDLEWERVRVSIPLKVFTTEQIAADIKALDGVGRQYANAARYMLETKKDYDTGLKYVDKSLALGEDWYNVWIKASLLAARGDYQDARAEADRAYEMGLKVGDEFFLEPEIRKAVQSWTRTAAKQQPPPGKRRVATSAAVTMPPTDPPPPPLIAIVTERSDEARGAEPLATGAATRPRAEVAGDRGERPAPLRRSSDVTVTSKATGTGTDVSPVLRKGRSDLQYCYQRALRQDPGLTRGRIDVSLTVGLSGRASHIALDTPERMRALEPCLRDVISRWAFPTSSSEYSVEFPVVLQGKSD